MKKTILLSLFVFSFALADDPPMDFEFKQMDIKKVILSIAGEQDRSVQFTQNINPRLVDVSLHDVTPSFAIRLLCDSYGLVYVLKGNVYHVMTPSERGPTATPMYVMPLKHVLASDIEENVRTFLGTNGSFSINKQLNALVVSAPDEVISHLRQVVEQLDQENAQIFIEAKVVETTTTFSRSLGMEWGPNLVSRPYAATSLSSPAIQDSLRIGFTTSLGAGGTLQARLTAGEQNGEVKILSQPKITTLNGVTASIASQLTFNVRTLAATGASAASVGSLQAVKAGLTLQVTPFIVSNEKVRLQISVSKSDPDDSARIDGIPGISDSSASTSLVVTNGQVASIGGLASNRKSSFTAGFPMLAKLPLIGLLFGSLENQTKDMELLIFLTPTIFRGTAVPKIQE